MNGFKIESLQIHVCKDSALKNDGAFSDKLSEFF